MIIINLIYFDLMKYFLMILKQNVLEKEQTKIHPYIYIHILLGKLTLHTRLKIIRLNVDNDRTILLEFI